MSKIPMMLVLLASSTSAASATQDERLPPPIAFADTVAAVFPLPDLGDLAIRPDTLIVSGRAATLLLENRTVSPLDSVHIVDLRIPYGRCLAVEQIQLPIVISPGSHDSVRITRRPPHRLPPRSLVFYEQDAHYHVSLRTARMRPEEEMWIPVRIPLRDSVDVHREAWADDRPLVLLRRIPPRYPLLGIRAAAEGLVHVYFSVDTLGAVRDPVVVRSNTIRSIEQAAIAAASQWRFIPAMHRGAPVESAAVIRFLFRAGQPFSRRRQRSRSAQGPGI